MSRAVTIGMLLLAAAAVPAAAVPIKYTIAGDFTGLDGLTAFVTTPLTFTGLGNTTSFTDNGAFTLVPVTLSVTNPVGAGKLAVTGSEAFGVFPAGGNVYFSQLDGAGHTTFSFPVIANAPAFAGYSGVAFEAATAAAFAGSSVFATSGGVITLLAGTNVSFTAAAVPEPALWLTMIAGFGLVGAGLRGRRMAAVAA